MKYFLLDFSCYGQEDQRSMDLHQSLERRYLAGEKRIGEIAKQHSIEMRHAYSWPDGSLFKYAKVENEDRLKVFNDQSPAQEDGRDYLLLLRFKADEREGTEIRENELTSLQELFSMTHPELQVLYMARHEQRDELLAPYDHHRKHCPKCPKPTGWPCDDGREVLSQCRNKQKNFVAGLVTA